MQRRLREVNRSSAIPASVRVDMAFDPTLDNDALEEGVTQMHSAFAAQAPTQTEPLDYGNVGWGISTILTSLLSREPQSVPETDIKTMQQRLIDQGYLPAGTQVDGVWSPQYASAARRADRDSFEDHLSGNHPLSVPVQRAAEYMGYMTPAGVFQTIVGAAKGVVEGIGQTISEGALTGAATGAATGAGIGLLGGPFAEITSPVGALVGGIIGAVGGLLGEAMSSDEGERDSSAIWDALTPFPEYGGKDGAGRFFNDVNTILTAATLVSGFGAAAKGAGETATVLRGGLGEALAKTATGRPGLLVSSLVGKEGATGVGNVVRGALKNALVGGAIGGFATGDKQGILEGALVGAGVGALGRGFSGPIRDFVAEHGLMAQHTRPLLANMNKVYTGLATAGFGSVVESDLLPGVSTVEKSIESEKRPGGALWNAADIGLGFVFFPEQLFPVKGGQIMDRLAESKILRDRPRLSYHLAAEGTRAADGTLMNRFQLDDAITRALAGATDQTPVGDIDHVVAHLSDLKLSLDAGRDGWVEQQLLARKFEEGSRDYFTEGAKLRSQYAREVNSAVDGDTEALGTLPDKMTWVLGETDDSLKGPIYKAFWLKNLEGGRGRGVIGGMAEQIQAERAASRANKFIDEVTIAGSTPKIDNEQYTVLADQAKELRKRADAINVLESADPIVAQGERQALIDQADGIEKSLENVPRLVTAPTKLTVANVHQPDQGIWGTPTQQEMDRTIKALREAADTFRGAGKNLNKGGDPLAIRETVQNTIDGLMAPTGILKSLNERRLITRKLFNEVTDGLTTGKVTKDGYKKLFSVADHLKSIKHNFGREVELTAEQRTRWGLPDTKTLVATGEDTYDVFDLEPLLKAANLDDVLQDTNKWDTLSYYLHSTGFAPQMRTDHAIMKFRRANQESTVNAAIRLLEKEGEHIPLNGRLVLKRIEEGMRDYNGGEGVIPTNALMHRKETTAGGVIKGKFGLPLLDVRGVKKSQIREWLDLDKLVGPQADEVAYSIYDALKKGSAMGGDMNFAHPITTAKAFARELRVDGWPGFVDLMRTWHIGKEGNVGFGTVFGGLAGAATTNDQGEHDWTDILTGAAIGAGSAGALKLLAKRFPTGTYGYLPEYLHRASMAMRYTFSLAFDAGRYWENATVFTAKEGGPFTLNPARTLKKNEWVSPFSGKVVDGETAYNEALQLGNRMRGRGDELEMIDEILAFQFQKGILGYSPRLQESMRAYMVASKHVAEGGKMDSSFMKWLDARSRTWEGYGIGRRTAEKSVNFFFFPFSFQKKLISTLADAVTQAPLRALLIHQGLKQYHQLGMDKRAGDFIERYIPIARQLRQLNNLAYGVSPGRFFLQGIMDHRRGGQVAQALGSLFVPSGANTPAAQLFGGLADAVHLFSPQIITDEHPIDAVKDAINNFVPAIRDIQRTAAAGFEQIKAPFEGGTEFYQTQKYLDAKRDLDLEYEPLAQALGYQSVDGFFSSDSGAPLKEEHDARLLELQSKYQVGFQATQSFENDTNLNGLLLHKLSQKQDRTPAEEELLRIYEMEQEGLNMGAALGVSQSDGRALVADQIRKEALKHARDPQFVKLWEQFYSYSFGPISRLAA